MSKNQTEIDEMANEEKMKKELFSLKIDVHDQKPNEQSDDTTGVLQQLLTKQDQLLDENMQLKNQVALQQLTINNLSDIVEALKSNPLSNHKLTTKPSPATTTTDKVIDLTTDNNKDIVNLQQQAAKKLQSKRIDQLLNSTPFSGTMSQEVSDWLEEFNTKCDKLQFDDAQRLSIAVDLLKDNAKLWYETHNGAIENWQTFTNKLMSHFKLVTGIDQFQLEQKLYNRRRQYYESAIDYCHNVLKLCSKVNREMSEMNKIKHLTQGLHPNALLHMELKNPNTTEEFLEALIKFDKWKMEEQNQRNQSTLDQRQNNWTNASNQTYATSNQQQQMAKSHRPSYDQKQQNSNGKEYAGCWTCGGMDHYQYQC